MFILRYTNIFVGDRLMKGLLIHIPLLMFVCSVCIFLWVNRKSHKDDFNNASAIKAEDEI